MIFAMSSLFDSIPSFRHSFHLACDGKNISCGFGLIDYHHLDPDNFKLSVLSPEETNYYQNLRVETRKKSFLFGRYVAKMAASILSQCNDLTVQNIARGVFSQPILYDPFHPTIDVSLSHSKNFATALSFPRTCPMSLDVEYVSRNPNIQEFLKLTPTERNLYEYLPYKTEENSTLMWTMKEALSKVLKTGLTTDLTLYEINNIIINQDYTLSEYTHFCQYKVYSWFYLGYAFSIIIPKNTDLDIRHFLSALTTTCPSQESKPLSNQ